MKRHAPLAGAAALTLSLALTGCAPQLNADEVCTKLSEISDESEVNSSNPDWQKFQGKWDELGNQAGDLAPAFTQMSPAIKAVSEYRDGRITYVKAIAETSDNFVAGEEKDKFLDNYNKIAGTCNFTF